MLRPVSLLPALVAVATLGAALVAPVAPAAAVAVPKARADDAPLVVTIDSLAPSTIPRKGPVRVTGSVTNRDDDTWQTINVYSFIGADPITTTAELAEAAATPASTEVGERIIDLDDPRTEYTIDELEPGESAQFSVTVPHRYLEKTEGGVYWFGVHALGDGPDGRVEGADGRARTFLPYVPPTHKSVDTALVLPLRRGITHNPDGSIANVPTWTKALSQEGRLRTMVDFGAAAGSRPITWLVDPAVPDTVAQLVAGNPPRSLEPTVTDDDGTDGGESGSPSPSDDPSDEPSDGESGEDAAPSDPAVAAAAEAGTAWLQRLHEALQGNQILTLPYGDVDVAAAAEFDPGVYRQARKRSNADLEPWGLPTSPVVAPLGGFIDEAGIRLTEKSTPVLVTDRMFGAHPPAVARAQGHALAVSSSATATGGPGPDDPLAAVAMRQRIVSEAALRLLSPGRKPLIVTFPGNWAPDSTGFFEGLDLDWLHLTTLTAATQRTGTPVPLDRLRYPDTQADLEDATSFVSAGDLVRAGDTLQNLLTQNDEVGSEVRDEAFTDTSYSNRLRPEAARTSADRSRFWIETRLRSVRIDAPKAVILSGGSGRFAATVTNGLDQPVTVKIEALPDAPLEVSVPSESVDIGPGSRATVLLNASSSALGIRNVTLALTDVQDVPLGSSDDLPIRSNQVSNVIWLILGTGVALLFGAIVVRLFRRIRAAARS